MFNKCVILDMFYNIPTLYLVKEYFQWFEGLYRRLLN